MLDMIIPVTNIQRFCMHDGPGLRTTVFLKGCPLRCKWCHNPETQSPAQQILFYKNKCIHCGACQTVCPTGAQKVGAERLYDREACHLCGTCVESCCTGALEYGRKDYSVRELLEVVERDRAFYGDKGGITVSGGEPMLHPQETLALLAACKENGIGTAVETCGFFEEQYLPQLVEYADLFLWDLKDTDEERHQKNTGVSNRKILDNLKKADRLGARTILRCIMVKSVNMEKTHYEGIAEVYHSLKNCATVELLPYHVYGGSKAVAVGMTDNGNEFWIPDSHEIEQVQEYLRKLEVKVK